MFPCLSSWVCSQVLSLWWWVQEGHSQLLSLWWWVQEGMAGQQAVVQGVLLLVLVMKAMIGLSAAAYA